MVDVRRVELDSDIQALRLLRNVCRDGFTRDNEYIHPDEQRIWWKIMSERVCAWLYGDGGTMPCGYGALIRRDDGRWWNSVGVPPKRRGLGYGSLITRDLIARHPEEPIYAAVHKDNLAAVHMHHAQDWERIACPNPDLIWFESRGAYAS